MSKLIIQHITNTDPAQFQVVRATDAKSAPPTLIPSPVDFPVEGRPLSDLRTELTWYLEEFLDYPFSPETERAERILVSLSAWGREVFNALFADSRGSILFEAAVAEGLENVHLEIVSDDPTVFSYPWEALDDPQRGAIAQQCVLTRRVNEAADPPPVQRNLPTEYVNILIVTARPFEGDVGYRTISRPLIELIHTEKLPARVTLLRPPTFQRLREVLSESQEGFHIVHFDGHGGYARGSATAAGAQGQLFFEKADGSADPYSAVQLSALLREYRVPAVVLNACQSGMIDDDAKDAYASVATALLRSGVRSVVAMAYSVYVSAAQEFLPSFYLRLFQSGSFAEASRAGRQQLVQQQSRVCAAGLYDLEDWLVPVVYEQHPLDFSFATSALPPAVRSLGDELVDDDNPYGFVGRDSTILALERAMHRKPAGLLISGLGGVGKTTLARGFARWLVETSGLDPTHFHWYRFDESVRSAESVVNRLGERILGANFSLASLDDRIAALSKVLNEERHLVVWDNFETVRGVSSESDPLLSEADQQVLKRLLSHLRGGASKVLITSRSDESWLDSANRFTLAIEGLIGEERWEYCNAILADLGIKPDRSDRNVVELMDKLNGHPLAMRVILIQLEDLTPTNILWQLKKNVEGFNGAGVSEARLFAALRFVEEGLSNELLPLLIPLGFHDRYIDASLLFAMASHADNSLTEDQVLNFLSALCPAGLLRHAGATIYELHPLLSSYLKHRPASSSDGWAYAFVRVMAIFADTIAPMPLHQQRGAIAVHGANLAHASQMATKRSFRDEAAAIAQALGAFAYNARDWATAEKHLSDLAHTWQAVKNPDGEGSAYHQLGRVAEDQGQLEFAEAWFRKSLALKLVTQNESGLAATYHHLGNVAFERDDFNAAEEWYRKSLALSEKAGYEYARSTSYHQLGMIADRKRDYAKAESLYLEAAAIAEKSGDLWGAAMTYHQLGGVALSERRFADAIGWFQKSLAIKESLGDQHGAAVTYLQLGNACDDAGDLDSAESWFRKALVIEEQLGELPGTGDAYYQLGIVALKRRDLDAAEAWLSKALAVREKSSDEQRTASTFHHLGIASHERGDFSGAERWYQQSLSISMRIGDASGIAGSYHQLGNVRHARKEYSDAESWYQKSLDINKELNDQFHQAANIFQLARVAALQGSLELACQRLVVSGSLYVRTGSSPEFQNICQEFSRLLSASPREKRNAFIADWNTSGLPRVPDELVQSLNFAD